MKPFRGEMGKEMGCREEREVGGDGWVDGRIRGKARQAFRTRILLYTAPTRCPSHMHACVRVQPHTLTPVCVRARDTYYRKNNPEKLSLSVDFGFHPLHH